MYKRPWCRNLGPQPPSLVMPPTVSCWCGCSYFLKLLYDPVALFSSNWHLLALSAIGLLRCWRYELEARLLLQLSHLSGRWKRPSQHSAVHCLDDFTYIYITIYYIIITCIYLYKWIQSCKSLVTFNGKTNGHRGYSSLEKRPGI